MTTLTRGGGATTRVVSDENRASPVFLFSDVAAAYEFASRLDESFSRIREDAESTTGHGRLLRLECQPVGRDVIVHFCYFTAVAHGSIMIVKDTEHPCQLVLLT